MFERILLSGAVLLVCVQISCIGAFGRRDGYSASDAGPTAVAVLPRLKAKRLWVSHMGCLMGCAEYWKLNTSAQWIYGVSGHAFALNVHEALCPSGPTAWPTDKCNALAANVGLVIDSLTTHKSEPDAVAKQELIWVKVRQAINEGIPCITWWLDYGEWYVIVGYDQNGNYLYDDFGRKIGQKHHSKLTDNPTGMATVLMVLGGQGTDDRTAVREAMFFAVEHGAGKHSHEKWHTGLAGYDTWIKALGNDKAIADKAFGFGLAYNAQCWAECRHFDVAFLKEAAGRLDEARLKPMFDEAIGHYTTVSKNLTAVAEMFPFKSGDGKGMDARAQNASLRAKAVKALTAARTAERAGLKTLAQIAEALAHDTTR